MISSKTLAELVVRGYVEETIRLPGDVEVLLETVNQTQCVVVRGTEFSPCGWMDIVRDIRILPWYDSRAGWGRAGFLKGAQKVLAHAGLRNLMLIKGMPVCLAGHSLGGAIACIVAAILLGEGKSPDELQLETFGCPRPGFDGLVEKLDKIERQKHWVNEGDLVTTVPPFGTPPRPIFHCGGKGHRMSEYKAGLP